MNASTTNPSPAASSAAGLVDDLWHHLKSLDGHCTESMSIALTPRAFDGIEGQRSMVRELQSWMLAHGYSSNVKLRDRHEPE